MEEVPQARATAAPLPSAVYRRTGHYWALSAASSNAALPDPAWQGGGNHKGSSLPPSLLGERAPLLPACCHSDPSEQPGQLQRERTGAWLLRLQLNICRGRIGVRPAPRSPSQGLPLAGTCWLQCVPGCREEAQPALAVSPRVLERMSHAVSAGRPLRQQP